MTFSHEVPGFLENTNLNKIAQQREAERQAALQVCMYVCMCDSIYVCIEYNEIIYIVDCMMFFMPFVLVYVLIVISMHIYIWVCKYVSMYVCI